MNKKMTAERCNSHIPTDLVFEKILIRVPAKSLMRFKLVCKLWQSTILHDRRFHLSHRSFSPSRPSLLAFVGPYFQLSLFNPAPPIYNQFDILFSQSTDMHGLEIKDQLSKIENRFICSSIPSSDSTSAHWEKPVWKDYHTTEVVNGVVCFYSNNNIYLCNLSTSETMKLPLPPPAHPVSRHHPCPYYLGFDDLNKEYKLLRSQHQHYSYNKDNSKILTLRHSQNQDQNHDCWRNTTETVTIGFQRSYCFRSSLYWIAKFGLMCFDLNKEKCSTIFYPFDPYDDPPASTFAMWNDYGGRYCDSLETGLTQVGGRLALTHSSVGSTEFNIWLLDDNYRKRFRPKWDKITIHIPIHLRDPISPSEILWSPFITIPAGSLPGTKKIVFTNGRAMLYKPLVGFHMAVYTYDLESETWETLDNPPAAASSSVQLAYKRYSKIYYFHEENILPLKDILAPK